MDKAKELMMLSGLAAEFIKDASYNASSGDYYHMSRSRAEDLRDQLEIYLENFDKELLHDNATYDPNNKDCSTMPREAAVELTSLTPYGDYVATR